MAGSRSVARATSPWTQQLFDALPIAPAWVGIALAVVLLSVFVSMEVGLGRFALYAAEASPEMLEDIRLAVIQCLGVGYVATAYVYALGSARRTLDQLRPILRGSKAQVAAWMDRGTRLDKRRLRIAGLVGALIAGSIPEAAELRLPPGNLLEMTPEALWHRALVPILGWLIGCFAHVTLERSRTISQLGAEVEVDLLDRRALKPFARHGLRDSLLWIGLLTVGSLTYVDVSAAPWLPVILPVFLVGALVFAGASLVRPVRGVRGTLQRAKRRELEWCNAEIRRARARIAGKLAVAAGPSTQLADLVAYRGVVESVSEWPFDASTFVRLLLYSAIPVGSWLGGAMVERAIDALLG